MIFMDATVELIPANPDNPYKLGRHVNHDPHNALHRALVAPPPRATTPYKAWYTNVVFDQGNSSSCTTQACIGMLHTSPNTANFTEWKQYDDYAERDALYQTSKDYDPWTGNAYDGTSTDAPFKVLRERGTISAWKWLFGEAEVREWVTWYGPCVVGTEWLNDMFSPVNGYLKVSGAVAGGHAWRIVQYSNTKQAYRMVNSWGKGWGASGRAWVHQSDLASLLANNGDAIVVG